MTQSLFATSGYRRTLRKLAAGLLMLSINLTGGVGALFLTARVAQAAPVSIFSEPFPSNNGNDVTGWTETETNSDYAKLSTSEPLHASPTSAKGHVRLTKNASIEKTISTVGYSSIVLKYYWRGDPDAESSDDLKVYWKTSSGSYGSAIATHHLNDTSWDQNTIALPVGANNTSIKIKFLAATSQDDEQARIDDIELSGEVITHTLDVALAGNGSGSVSSSPSGINCGVDCSESYTQGTVVTLSATPATGSTFTGWSGAGCSGTGTCVVTMSSAKSVTATFTLDTYALNVGINGLGSVTSSPAGISCVGDCTENYNYGTEVTLTPSADTGYTFSGWSGACTGSGSCAVAMTEAQEVVATFTLDTPPEPISCEADTSTMTVVSDTSDMTAPETPAVPTFEHNEWTADNNISGATWIWDAYHVADPSSASTVTFTKTFTVTGTPTSGSIVIAADNTYTATLNGSPVGSSVDLDNFHAGNEDTYDVSSLLVSGENTLEITVTNAAADTNDPEANPAGLLYKLTIEKNSCEPAPVLVCDPEVNLLENPGFEAPALSNPSWSIVPFTDSALKWLGAFVNPDNTDHLGLEIQNHVAGSPSEGAQYAELDGYHPTTIWQNIATNPGYDYALTFKYSPRPGTALGNNVLEVRKDDVALGAQISRGSTSGDTEWSTESRTFEATGASTKIEFADVSSTDDSLGTYLDDMKLSCVGPHVAKATVVATKVVCDNESDLPNWSGTHHEINSTTATDYVSASNGACHIAPDWQFQWAPTSAGNPGDNTGEAGSPWTTFVSSALITLGDMTSVWVREVYDDAYVAFTGTADVDNVSAEMYCNGDAYHYDNLDYANGLTDGGTVYCVAFNAPKPVVTHECDAGQHWDGEQCVNDEQEGSDTMTVTVIKHVINDNGGTKEAGEFTLHISAPEQEDLCNNIEGTQTEVPSGMERVTEGEMAGGCFYPVNNQEALNTILNFFSVKTAYATVVELFTPSTFSGNEEGTDIDVAYETDYVVTEDADAGYTTTYSEGCTGHIAPGEHKTCVVTNDDILQGGGGGGSTFSPYPGCTNPEATNYNSLANEDDGSCQLPGGNGGENGGGNGEPQGEVLGAETTEPSEPTLPPACVGEPYLRDYLKMGRHNDPEQVKLLQGFLNEYMDAHLPLSGFFGPLTKKWVKKLQKDNLAAIIQPWIDAGYDSSDIKEGTGVVYKTTKYFINKTKCDAMIDPMPDLHNDQGF